MTRVPRIALALLFAASCFPFARVHAQVPAEPHTRESVVRTLRPVDPGHPNNGGGASQSRPTGDVSIGEVAPGFTLDANDGTHVKLATLRGSWIALVFGDTRQQLGVCDSLRAALTGENVAVLAIVRESAQALRRYAQQHGCSVRALADVTGEVAMVYGFWSDADARTQSGYVVIDPQGLVRANELSAQPLAAGLAAAVRSAMRPS